MNYKIYSIYSDRDLPNDGTLDDTIWNRCGSVSLNCFDGTDCPEHLKTHVSSFWTKRFLYVGYEGKFDKVRTTPNNVKTDSLGKTMDLWDLSDVYELFIGPKARKTRLYRELQIAPDNRWIDLTLDFSGPERLADFKWTSGMKACSKIDNDKKIWSAVFKIPVEAFDEPISENAVWNLNFYRIHGEGDRKQYLAWSPVYELKFHQPDKFGDIIFIK